jgi:haloalkane dehalogenase
MTWEEFPPDGAEVFRAIKAPGVDDIPDFLTGLPAEYARPYPTPASRIPLLRWAQSLPLGGEPASVVSRIESFDAWLASTPEIPKLLITFEPGPGTMLTPPMIDWFSRTFASLEVAHHPVVAGHHTPEDQPELIAKSLAQFIS